MRYTYETKKVIKRNRSEVIDAFLDYDNMQEWQPALCNVSLKKGSYREKGHVVQLSYITEKGTTYVMNETILELHLPHKIVIQYQMGSTLNTQTNHFESYGADTLWIVETIFDFQETPEHNEMAFQRRTRKGMTQFKRYVEGL